MTDVRLTATNPEDSSVVPVLCNAKGELKLEEPILVEGEKGEKGDKGDPGAPGKDGDPFTGQFSGDVYFDGNVLVAGYSASMLTLKTTNTGSGARSARIIFEFPDGPGGRIQAQRPSNEDASEAFLTFSVGGDTPDEERMRIQADGKVGINTNNPRALLHLALAAEDESVYFRGGGLRGLQLNDVTRTGSTNTGDLTRFFKDTTAGAFSFNNQTEENLLFIQGNGNVGISTDDPKAKLDVAGDIWAADKKAGFTSAGELIFYSRNERYRAVAQNGNMMCEPYTPEMELREKAEAWAEKDKKPSIKPIEE